MKKALILFPDPWLAYSPYVLNIKQLMEEKSYDVTIICTGNYRFDNSNISGNIHSLYFQKWFLWLLRKFRITNFIKYNFFFLFAKFITFGKKYDMIFGVDSMGYLTAKKLFTKSVYVSLELVNDKYHKRIIQKGIDHLIILNKFRKDYLVSELPEEKVSYIVNSPIIDPELYHSIDISKRKSAFLHIGNQDRYQYIDRYIEFVKKIGDPFYLQLKGFITDNFRNELLDKFRLEFEKGIVRLDTEYIDQDKILPYCSEHYIGFAFYNFDHIGHDNLNLLSTTSGKLLNNICAGVPVIASDIIGFQLVKEYNVGVLLKELTVDSLLDAYREISSNYQYYVNNCIIAAKDLDFRARFEDFIFKYNQNA